MIVLGQTGDNEQAQIDADRQAVITQGDSDGDDQIAKNVVVAILRFVSGRVKAAARVAHPAAACLV